MAEQICAVERVSNFGDQIVVEFSDGVTARFSVDFLVRSRTLDGNGIVEDRMPEQE